MGTVFSHVYIYMCICNSVTIVVSQHNQNCDLTSHGPGTSQVFTGQHLVEWLRCRQPVVHLFPSERVRSLGFRGHHECAPSGVHPCVLCEVSQPSDRASDCGLGDHFCGPVVEIAVRASEGARPREETAHGCRKANCHGQEGLRWFEYVCLARTKIAIRDPSLTYFLCSEQVPELRESAGGGALSCTACFSKRLRSFVSNPFVVHLFQRGSTLYDAVRDRSQSMEIQT